MNTIIHPLKRASRKEPRQESATSTPKTRRPHYDCQEVHDTLKVTVYVPGVAASGVEITTRGPDLLVTARKAHFVRVNFSTLNLERVQNDYLLSLRLGRGLDYAALQAEIHEGVLTLMIPKKVAATFPSRDILPSVA